MRAVYFIRHGSPDFPEGKKVCIGRTDYPLSEDGLKQAAALKDYFSALYPLKVYTSPLTRCVQTAQSIFEEFETLDDICEVGMGEWEGLGFSEIRERWPEHYQNRGNDILNIPAPGGESLKACGHRGALALKKVLDEIRDQDVVFVTHDGLIRSMLTELIPVCGILEERLPYGSVTAVVFDDEPVISYKGLVADALPEPFSAECCEAFFERCQTPEHVRAHGRAVAEKALWMCDVLEEKGYGPDRYLVKTAALLHDARKTEKHHAKAAAEALTDVGQPSLAAIVGDHMKLPEGLTLRSNNAIVYLADKLIREETEVSLEARFFDNMKPEFEEFATAKYRTALRLLAELND